MLRALGYAGFGSDKLEDWRQFGTSLVGLQAVERGNSQLSFRMDDRKQRIVVDRAMGEGARFFGWEVADAAAPDSLAARLEAVGVAVTAEPWLINPTPIFSPVHGARPSPDVASAIRDCLASGELYPDCAYRSIRATNAHVFEPCGLLESLGVP